MKRGCPLIKEMRKLQGTTNNLIPRSCFSRVAKEYVKDINYDLRVSNLAMDMLHEVSEEYLIKNFQAANLMAIAAKRETVTPTDLKTVIEVGSILK